MTSYGASEGLDRTLDLKTLDDIDRGFSQTHGRDWSVRGETTKSDT